METSREEGEASENWSRGDGYLKLFGKRNNYVLQMMNKMQDCKFEGRLRKVVNQIEESENLPERNTSLFIREQISTDVFKYGL